MLFSPWQIFKKIPRNCESSRDFRVSRKRYEPASIDFLDTTRCDAHFRETNNRHTTADQESRSCIVIRDTRSSQGPAFNPAG